MIEGVNISDLISEARNAVKKQTCDVAIGGIKGIMFDMVNLEVRITRTKTELAKAEGQLEGLRKRLAEIESGKWELIPIEVKETEDSKKKEQFGKEDKWNG